MRSVTSLALALVFAVGTLASTSPALAAGLGWNNRPVAFHLVQPRVWHPAPVEIKYRPRDVVRPRFPQSLVTLRACPDGTRRVWCPVRAPVAPLLRRP
jgi:hypothetical protein